MRIIIEPDYDKMSKWAADYVAKRIQVSKPTAESLSNSASHEDKLV